ncbi:MAG: MFS transporter [Coriobacteriales bacterium]|jgi:MFS family permease
MGKEYKKTAVAACLVMAAMIAGTASFGFFMDPVTQDLGLSRGLFSFYFSIITVVGALSLPVYGRLVERVGVRRIVIAGGIWTALALAAFSLCSSLWSFYLVAALVGLGFFGCSYCAAPVIVDNWFVEKNGSVMGAAAAFGGLVGVALGFIFPGIIEALGWRFGYICLGALVFLLTVPAGAFLLHSTPEEVGLEPFGSKNVSEGDAEPVGEVQGMTRSEALKSPKFYFMLIAFVIFAAAVSFTQHLAAYFVSIGMSQEAAGAMVSVISLGIVITSALVGPINDKLGLSKTILICAVLYVLAFVLLPVAGLSSVLIVIALFCMALGNAFNSIFAPIMTSAVFGQKDYSSLWGIISMGCVLGQAIGTPLWGMAYDLTGGYQAGMYVAAVLNIIGTVSIMFVLKSVKQPLQARTSSEKQAERA